MAVQNEDLIFTTQVKGDQELDNLRAEIDAVKVGSEELGATTKILVDKLAQLSATAAKVEAFRALKKEVVENTAALAEAQKKVNDAAKALAAIENPTKKQIAEFDKLRKSVGVLKDGLEAQNVALQRSRTALDAAGVSTRNLNASQSALREITRATRGAIVDNITDLRAMASQHKATAKAGAEGQAEVQQAIKQTTGMAGALRSAFALLSTYVGFQTIVTGLKSIIATGDKFEKFRFQLESTFQSGALGEQAFEWIKEFARTTPLRVSQVLEAFVKLKNFGLDPTKGALQAIVDQNAKVGGSQVKLERVILGVGQAWAKQRLQNEEILQLIEAGVPVYQILEKQLNLTTLQITKMAEQGKLGRDVIQKLLDGIASNSAGAAQKQMATLSGLISNAADNMELFFDLISRSGAITYLKSQVTELNNTFVRLTNSGHIKKYAQDISNAFVSIASTIKTATVFVVDHAAQIYEIGRAYLVFKGLSFVTATLSNIGLALSNVAGSMSAAKNAAGALGIAMRAIPASLLITVALLGAEKAIATAKSLGERLAENSEAVQSTRRAQQAYAQSVRDMADAYTRLRDSLSQYNDVALLSAEQVARLSDIERKAYKDKLEGLQQYLQAQAIAEQKLIDIGDITAEQAANTFASITTLKTAFADLATGADISVKALKESISVEALVIAEKLGGISASAALAEAGIKGVFQGLDVEVATVTKLGDIALAVTALAGASKRADDNLKSGLRTTLNDLSTIDLLKFQSSSIAAFATFNTDSRKSAVVLDTILQLALERVGVSADKMGLSFTTASREAIAAFTVITENARSTASQVEAAFDAALAQLTSVDQVRALGDELAAAFSQGKLSADAMARSTDDITRRLRELELQINPLADSFARLGVKSQQELDNIAASAKEAFDAISDGAATGQASIEDVRAAFVAYAKAQLDAVRNSDEFKRSQVEARIALEASALGADGAKKALDELGLSGLDAGDKVAKGANAGAAALGGLAGAASDVKVAMDDAGAGADALSNRSGALSSGLDSVADSARGAANELGQVSSELSKNLQTYAQFDVERTNRLLRGLSQEREEANRRLQRTNEQIAQLDPLEKALDGIRRQYKGIGEDQVKAIADADAKLAQLNKTRAEAEETIKRVSGGRNAPVDVNEAANIEAERKKAESAKKALEDAKLREQNAKPPLPAAPPIATPPATIKSELVLRLVNDQQSGAPVKFSSEQMELIVDAVVTRLQRSQSNS